MSISDLKAQVFDGSLSGSADIPFGPTGKVRKFLMRERLLAAAGAPAAEESG